MGSSSIYLIDILPILGINVDSELSPECNITHCSRTARLLASRGSFVLGEVVVLPHYSTVADCNESVNSSFVNL